MNFSGLITRSVQTNKYSSRGGRKITQLIIHHTAGGSNQGNVDYLSKHSAKVSATYVLQTNGNLVGIVPEKYRPWTTGGIAADGPSVTVETVNSTRGPSWEVTDAQLDKLARLAADLAYRYGWGDLNRQNVRGHREFMSTSCPGPYLWGKRDSIIAQANKYLKAMRAGDMPAPKPGTGSIKPLPPQTGNSQLPPSAPTPTKSVSQMAQEVIDGKHGNGHSNRQKSLGVTDEVYQKVRAEVNRRVSSKPKPKPSPTKSVSQMAQEVIDGKHGNGHANRQKSLGVTKAKYEEVRAEVNRRVSSTGGKTINQMVEEVLAGKHGNGHFIRRRSLGVSAAVYQQVRAEVNRRQRRK